MLVAITCTACAVGPNFKTPELDLPKRYSFRTTPAITVHSGTVELKQNWWSCFRDPVLDELLAQGIKANFDVRMALDRVNEARAYQGEALLGLFPDVNINPNYTEGKFGTATNPFFTDANRDFRAYRAGLELSWEIDLFGRVRRVLESRRANRQALEAVLDDMLVTIQAQIVESYLQLRTAQLDKNIIKSSAKKQKESLAIATALYESGSSNALDLALARSQWHSTQARLPKIAALANAALNQLALLTGQHVSQLPDILKKIAPLPICTGALTIKSPELLIRSRPDIRIAENELAKATALIGVETSAYFPQIHLLGTLGVEAKAFDGLGDTNSDFYSWGPSITWKILNAGRINKRVKAAGENASYAFNNYQKAVFKALAEIETTLKNYQSEKLTALQLVQAAMHAKRASNIARSQYEVGALDLFRVLESETAALDAEQALLQARNSFNLAYISVYRALGGDGSEWPIAPK